eukprot:TRINITY_DN63398_c0_g1_i1.p1 TRINITY_DN63398_c0_g1~~TRINITY_DN63398_c0_g1_i1.p1  ORF type:complete len:340 (-),score=46.02 TRINITY_DN63398_c0_g1_i1:76-1071(-)
MPGAKSISFLLVPFALCTHGFALLIQLATSELLVQTGSGRPLPNQSQGLGDRGDVFDQLPFSSDLAKFARGASHFRLQGANLRSDRHFALRRKPMLWLHIHKAGGSFMCMMAETAGESVVQPNSNCNWENMDGYHDSGFPDHGISCAERAHYFKMQGVTWAQIEREVWETDKCWNEFFYGVLLREPISLMRSMMNYHPESGRSFLQAITDELQNASETSSSQDRPWKFMDNFQTRVLASAMAVPAGQINDGHLAEASRVLEHFHVIAHLEELPGVALDFVRKIGWSTGMAAHIGDRQNPSSEQIDFTPEEDQGLRNLNKFDIALYDKFGWS